jgi:hypothetical protein
MLASAASGGGASALDRQQAIPLEDRADPGACVLSARQGAVAGAVVAVVLAGIALVVGLRGLGRGPVMPPALAQHSAPLFTRPLASLKAGTFSLGGQRGHPVLLSFLNTQAEATASNDPSRAEIVFIKSMNTQNRRYGLRTVIVDAADAAGTSPPSRDALVNFTFGTS